MSNTNTSSNKTIKRRRASRVFRSRDDEDFDVIIDVPAHNGDPSRRFVAREWAPLPHGIFRNDAELHIEIHAVNANNWPNPDWPSPVRIWRPSKGKWEYIPGSPSTRHPDKPWYRVFRIEGSSQYLQRLVLIAHDRLPRDNEVARHIVDVPNGEYGDDSLANLKWGTVAQNRRDTPRAGNTTSKARPFRGKILDDPAFARRDKGSDWIIFRTLQDGETRTNIPWTHINYSLRTGKPRRGKDKVLWIFERFSSMELEDGEEWAALTHNPSACNTWRFCTSLGRVGEIVTTRRRIAGDSIHTRRGDDGTSIVLREGETICEVFPAGDGHGYKVILVDGKQEYLSRIVVELLRPEWMHRLDASGNQIPWGELDVDHIIAADVESGGTHDDSLTNLSVKTRQEHRDKNAKAVVELDARGHRLPGRAWISIAAASRALEIDSGSISAVCNKKNKYAGGRVFAFVSSITDEIDQKTALAEAHAASIM